MGAAPDIFVISDLHLGDGGPRDNFEANGKTKELFGFLDHVGAEGGELFVLGDLFELWQTSLSRLFVNRRELLDRFARLDLVYVPGNHDVDLAHFIGTGFIAHPFFGHMRAPFFRPIGGKRFRFFHGHEVDPFNAGDDPGFGRMLAIFAAIFEDRNRSPLLRSGEAVEEVLEQFGDSMLMLWTGAMAALGQKPAKEDVEPKAALTPAQNPDRRTEHVREVNADRERRGYDVAVLGHTHQAGRIGEWYFNSGSWTGRRNPFLRISPDGHVRYFEWAEGRAVEREVPVLAAPEARSARSTTKHPLAAPIAAVRTLFPKPTKPERSRWALLVQGALALALGLGSLTVTIGHGASAGLRVLVTAFGLYALIEGALSLFVARREHGIRRLVQQVRGVASLLLGLVVLRRGYAVEVFVILVGVYAFAIGALRVAAAVVLKPMVDSRWLFLVGAGSMLAGLVLLLLPASVALLKLGLAAYLCYYGVTQILAGIFGRRHARRARRESTVASMASAQPVTA